MLIMIFDSNEIHMGSLVKQRIVECKIGLRRISKFMGCSEIEVEEALQLKSFNTGLLLKYCVLLKYDFFRVYSQYLLLHVPATGTNYNMHSDRRSSLPQFKKNVYTKKIIDFILDEINTGKKTKKEIIEEYKIPKTTLYKWVARSKGKIVIN